MKLLSCEVRGRVKVGLLLGERIVDLESACSKLLDEGFPSDMLSLLETKDEEVIKIRRIEHALNRQPEHVRALSFSLRTTRILAPIPHPRKNIICLGLNYVDHAMETGSSIPSCPVLFTKPPTTVVGMNDHVTYPKSSNEVDYEVELAFIFSRRGKNISEEEAYDYIAGYTILIDVTARDLQRKHVQWFKGKSLDTFAPMGPYLVTKDEIQDPHNLEIMMKVGGKVMQKSNTSNMIFKIPSIVKTVSMDMTVEPGDIVGTGTPAGVGFTRKPPFYLNSGDVLEASVEGIGVLRNTVAL